MIFAGNHFIPEGGLFLHLSLVYLRQVVEKKMGMPYFLVFFSSYFISHTHFRTSQVGEKNMKSVQIIEITVTIH